MPPAYPYYPYYYAAYAITAVIYLVYGITLLRRRRKVSRPDGPGDASHERTSPR